MRADPQEMQTWIDETARDIACPYLAVFGSGLQQPEREYMTAVLPAAQIEEWPGSGHFVHLAELERFSERLLRFIEACTSQGP